MTFIGVIFTFTYHTRQLNPWQNSSTSRRVNYSRLPCQGKMALFEDHPSTCGCLTSPRNKSSLGNFLLQYLAELLVNVYSYPLIVKSVSCSCVHGGRFSQIRPYTSTHIHTHTHAHAHAHTHTHTHTHCSNKPTPLGWLLS